jgi:hypothetical protein
VWCSLWGTDWILKYHLDELRLQRVNLSKVCSCYVVLILLLSLLNTWISDGCAREKRSSFFTQWLDLTWTQMTPINDVCFGNVTETSFCINSDLLVVDMDLKIALRHSVEVTLTTNSRNREKVTCYIEFWVKLFWFSFMFIFFWVLCYRPVCQPRWCFVSGFQVHFSSYVWACYINSDFKFNLV